MLCIVQCSLGPFWLSGTMSLRFLAWADYMKKIKAKMGHWALCLQPGLNPQGTFLVGMKAVSLFIFRGSFQESYTAIGVC